MSSQALAIVWFAAAGLLGIGEIILAGSFFLAPFAIGSLAAAITALVGGGFYSFGVFVVVTIIAFLALRPLARQLDKNMPEGDALGANRLLESEGTVVEEIPGGPGNAGLIKIGSETWRAESANQSPIPVGTLVKVSKVTGTRLTVLPIQ